jgi:hypothetical protein
MTFEEFKSTLTDPSPPADASPVLQALWHDATGRWAAAHEVAQGGEGAPAFDRLHAYLHRKEGDAFNAEYWYRRARAPVFKGTLAEEWDALVAEHLT